MEFTTKDLAKKALDKMNRFDYKGRVKKIIQCTVSHTYVNAIADLLWVYCNLKLKGPKKEWSTQQGGKTLFYQLSLLN